jgi:hypothetical protein
VANRIDCVNKQPRNDPHRRIQNVGGRNADGSRWKLSEERAINGVLEGRWRFYVEVRGKAVEVIVAEHEGRRYLKTMADGLQPDNLLSLPECP